ncbi:MAG: gas vesicle protein GvpG [Deltaproteobacteria bacterium]|nr:gas vesicle protein GvpG [Deltaproteobacteria bacterium]
MLIVDSLIIGGVKFVLTRLAEAVEAEMYDETALREELLAAQMKLELGEIDEEEFAAIEIEVLRGLREVGERKRAAAAESRAPAHGGKLTIERVSAELDHREAPED